MTQTHDAETVERVARAICKDDPIEAFNEDARWALAEDRYAAMASAALSAMPAQEVSVADASLTAALDEIADLKRERNHANDCADVALAEIERLRGEREPDFCYDPEDWEATHDWATRCEMEESLLIGPGRGVGHVARVCTLMRGPDKWVAEVVTVRDEDGDPDGWDVQWFDTEEAARAALKEGV